MKPVPEHHRHPGVATAKCSRRSHRRHEVPRPVPARVVGGFHGTGHDDRFVGREDEIIPNVKTYVAADPSERAYILEHIAELVVKSVNASGGYGMLIGPQE